jgi:hypothetical protein
VELSHHGEVTPEQRSAMQRGLVVSASIAGLPQADRSRTLCDLLAGLTGTIDLDLPCGVCHLSVT